MRWTSMTTIAVAVAALSAPPIAAAPQLDNLPAAVRAAVKAETKNATITHVAKEKEHGKTVYEIESLVGNRRRDFMVDASGKVYEIEEQLDLAQAPAAVRAAIVAKGTVQQLELVTTNGTVHYEGKAKSKAGKMVSFDLDANGRPMKH